MIFQLFNFYKKLNYVKQIKSKKPHEIFLKMILIEFERNLNQGNFVLKYGNVNDNKWNYLKIDIETLNLLVRNFGVDASFSNISTNETPDKIIKLKYCGSDVQLFRKS